jgi:hypothetical protein
MTGIGRRKPLSRWSVLLMIPLLMSAAPVAATEYPDDLIWSRSPRPSLQDSHQYVLSGELLDRLCHYSYPEVELASAEIGWEVHDLAVSQSTCTKVVLEGAPSGARPQELSATVIERNSRYQQQLWMEDVAGITLAWSQTKISWWWDGSCALGGNTYRYYDMFEQSGWTYVSGNKSSSSSCSSYIGNSWVTFKNSYFCSVEPGWTAPVYIYMNRNQITGRYNGTVSLSYAMTNSATCAGFFYHRSYGSY